MARRRTQRRRLHGALRWPLLAFVLVSAVAVAYVLYEAVAIQSAWSAIERVSLDEEFQENSPGSESVTVEQSERNADLIPAPPPMSASGEHPGVARGDPPTDPSPSLSPPTRPEGSRSALAASTTTTTTRTTTSATAPADAQASRIVGKAEEAPPAIAVVGTDSREGLEDLQHFGEFEGRRADVIMLAIRTDDGPALLSIPRDLYVEDSCGGGRHRIGQAFAGCGDRSGLANLVGQLEDLTGLEIGHAVAIDMAGFQSVVDRLGGYEICTDRPIRDPKAGLDLDGGCHQADGETTLAWLRSRHTQELVDGRWRTVEGVSDLARNQRQRQFLLDMFDRLADRPGPAEVRETLRAVAPHMIIDEGLSVADAAAWIWRLREADVDTHQIPVTNERTEGGASVLVPTRDVERVVHELSS